MKKTYLLLTVAAFSSLSMAPPPKSIYHNGWIDFNKNGAKDIYVNPAKRNVLVVKNETRILEQKRKVIQKFQ